MVAEGEKNPHLKNRFWGNRQTLIFRIDISDFWLLEWAIKYLFPFAPSESHSYPWTASCKLLAIHLLYPGKEKSKLTPLAFKPVDLRNILLKIRPLSHSFWLFKQFYSKKDTGVQILLLTVLGGRNYVFPSLVGLFYQPLYFWRDSNMLVRECRTVAVSEDFGYSCSAGSFLITKKFSFPLGYRLLPQVPGKGWVAQKLHRQEESGKLPGLYWWVRISL